MGLRRERVSRKRELAPGSGIKQIATETCLPGSNNLHAFCEKTRVKWWNGEDSGGFSLSKYFSSRVGKGRKKQHTIHTLVGMVMRRNGS